MGSCCGSANEKQKQKTGRSASHASGRVSAGSINPDFHFGDKSDDDEEEGGLGEVDEEPALPDAGILSPGTVRRAAGAARAREQKGRKAPSLKECLKEVDDQELAELLQGKMSKQEISETSDAGKRLKGDTLEQVMFNAFRRLFQIAGVIPPPELEEVVHQGCDPEYAATPLLQRKESRRRSGSGSGRGCLRPPLPPKPEDMAEELPQPPRGWKPRYLPGAKGTDKNVLLYASPSGTHDDKRRVGDVSWQVDESGMHFDVKVSDSGNWYKLMDVRFFQHMRDTAAGTAGPSWGKPVFEKTDYDKKQAPLVACHSWTRKSPDPKIKYVQLRIAAEFAAPMTSAVLFDILQDAAYRSVWDQAMVCGRLITDLCPSADIGYYQAKIPVPLFDNREFCNQRGWRNLGGGEFIICNFSVDHPEEKKGSRDKVIRAISYQTSYYMKPRSDGGCLLYYFSHSDPGGWMPSSLVNYLTGKLAPGQMEKLALAGKDYPKWLEKNWKLSDGGTKRLAGPWDKTSEKGGDGGQPYYPRHPKRETPAKWDTPELPWDWEVSRFKELFDRRKKHHAQLIKDEEKQRRWLAAGLQRGPSPPPELPAASDVTVAQTAHAAGAAAPAAPPPNEPYGESPQLSETEPERVASLHTLDASASSDESSREAADEGGLPPHDPTWGGDPLVGQDGDLVWQDETPSSPSPPVHRHSRRG
eukprot:TRINITY_DN70589_c0_g1_i1.p1 TRINITY_DN70589_c0_g1~~TRINITY_DN70589_c0_g1_i1.p1  ORF type:complete len:698 (+),score=144.15 TRINITY_DN70589_c0_g1_i1:98-2191(+)